MEIDIMTLQEQIQKKNLSYDQKKNVADFFGVLYEDIDPKKPKHLCATDIDNITMIWPALRGYLVETIVEQITSLDIDDNLPQKIQGLIAGIYLATLSTRNKIPDGFKDILSDVSNMIDYVINSDNNKYINDITSTLATRLDDYNGTVDSKYYKARSYLSKLIRLLSHTYFAKTVDRKQDMLGHVDNLVTIQLQRI